MPPLSPLLIQSLAQAPAKTTIAVNEYDVTLDITRLSTSYTTTVSPLPVATSISRHTAQLIPRSNPDSDNTPVVVGAILGSILGAALLITLWYKCCYNNRSAIWIPYFITNRDYDSERTSRVKHRGGGGDGFDCFNIRSHKVRRPERARTRKERWDRNGVRMSEIERRWKRSPRRPRASSCRTRRARAVNRDGLFGWVLETREPRNSPKYREERELEDD